MAASLAPAVNLWVKAEPFTYGALPVAPHPRLSYTNIKKIVSYAKSKGKAGFPRLSYSVWRHIACNKLQLVEEHAWMYFVTYDLVCGTNPGSRLEWDNIFAKCTSQATIDHLKGQVAVPTFEFVLFLFIQQLNKISLRLSLNEEWPMRARSPELDGRSTPTGGKGLDEHSHMTFLLNNLNDIMEMLVEPDSYAVGSSTNDLTLSVEAVNALGFLIGGSMDSNKTIRPLVEIAMSQQIQQKTGYSKLSRSFSFRCLQTWLRSSMGPNPFGISCCIAKGKRLSWPLSGEEREGRSENKRGRIATNAVFVPKDKTHGNKIIIMSQVCKQTIARSSSTLENSSVKVHRCHYSFLYLLAPLRSVSIEKCRHTTIVLGAVETCVHVSNCEHLTVITATRRISISGSQICFLYLLTPTVPLILGGNDTILLAPYHTSYPKLEEHMEKVGLTSALNLWDQPLCLGPDHHDDLPVWELLPPKEFYTFNVPFEMEGGTRTIPGGIPPKYNKALMQRERQIDNWQKAVQEAGLTKDQRKQFQGIVEERFQEWLAETGHKRELDALAVSYQVPSRPK